MMIRFVDGVVKSLSGNIEMNIKGGVNGRGRFTNRPYGVGGARLAWGL